MDFLVLIENVAVSSFPVLYISMAGLIAMATDARLNNTQNVVINEIILFWKAIATNF